MKWIVAGGRNFHDKAFIYDVLNKTAVSVGLPDEVVTGGASGVDMIGHQWAIENNLPTKEFMAEWLQFGKAAGPIRNEQMARYVTKDNKPAALVLIWNGNSPGSRSMKKIAQKYGIDIKEVIY